MFGSKQKELDKLRVLANQVVDDIKLLEMVYLSLESVLNSVFITDHNGNIMWVNKAFTATMGYEQSEVIGKNPRIFKSGVHDAAFYKGMYDTINSGQVWIGTVVNRLKSGELQEQLTVITPLLCDDGTIYFIAVKQISAEEINKARQKLLG